MQRSVAVADSVGDNACTPSSISSGQSSHQYTQHHHAPLQQKNDTEQHHEDEVASATSTPVVLSQLTASKTPASLNTRFKAVIQELAQVVVVAPSPDSTAVARTEALSDTTAAEGVAGGQLEALTYSQAIPGPRVEQHKPLVSLNNFWREAQDTPTKIPGIGGSSEKQPHAALSRLRSNIRAGITPTRIPRLNSCDVQK